MFDIWILTFERPTALKRLTETLSRQGKKPNVFSNSPDLVDVTDNVDRIVINSLNDRNSSSWCARSWNSIFLKGFENSDALVCIQDDTMVGPDFINWLTEQSKKYDFISGPAGDQFFYIHKKVFQRVGWWDERFSACYAGDADFFKRVYIEYDPERVSIQDSHNWGWTHNPCGVTENVITTYESKTVDPNYDNQHWVLERLCSGNPVLRHSQNWYKRKWGIDLDINKPAIDHVHRFEDEINWYPSHSKIYGVTKYD